MNDLSLLPSRPEEFFALATGYDRRDLKRAYGKAIRQYKPETHPTEFQLIRDAYERLEKSLRYGRRQQQQSDAANAWVNASPTRPETSASTRDTPGKSADPMGRSQSQSSQRSRTGDKSALTLHQIAVIDPGAAMKRLQGKKRRTPQDYFLAAVLEDATTGKPTSRYLGQLLQGLVAFPNDPGLTSLAAEFVRLEVTDATAEKVVRYIARTLRSPLFYLLSEPLWLRMVETQPFQQVRKVLAACEQDIRQTETTMRTTFYLRFLRSAMWTAPAAWTNELLAEIESESASLDPFAQSDLEFLSDVHRLRSQSSANRQVIRKQLLHAMRLSCRSDESAAIAQMVQMLNDIARDAGGMQRAFPMNNADEDLTWTMLTFRMIEQMQLYLDEPIEVEQNRVVKQTVHLIADLEPSNERVLAGIRRARWLCKILPMTLWIAVGMTVGMIILAFMPFIFGSISVGMVIVIMAVLLVVLFTSFSLWIFPKYLNIWRATQQQTWLMRGYAKYWRARLFRYAQSSGEAMSVNAARIESVCQKSGRPEISGNVSFFIQQDYGLIMFAALQTLLR